ncbi:MAG: hypothetical protein MUF81_16580 [Verrucomicrobia bacterium]|nr:hypothetical protein [Verrucomicrobiota bacterium]
MKPVQKGLRVKIRHCLALVAVIVLAAGAAYFLWQRDAPRRNSGRAIETFAAALNSGNADSLLKTVVLPVAVSGRTSAEQIEFLTKALHDEISPEGIGVLKREGQFGSLTNLFPVEAKTWAEQAGVNPEDCVAFRMERNGLRAEVVLVNNAPLATRHSSLAFRIVRCNNVKQLAAAKL